jgi:metal-responsive CopG/Arc/MetJ family transcriptional regulator
MGKRLIGAQLDQDFIDQIDSAAETLGVNRSTFIRQALQMWLLMYAIEAAEQNA